MLLINWLSRMVAFPLVTLGSLLGGMGVQWSERLLYWAARISGDGAYYMAFMGQFAKADQQAALALSANWRVRTNPVPFETMRAGLAAECGNVPLAEEYLRNARAAGADPAGLCDHLEFLLVLNEEQADAAAFARQLESRRDLNPLTSKLVYGELMWDALARGDLSEAERHAGKLVVIENDPAAQRCLWAVAMQRGDSAAADRYELHAATGPLDAQIYYRGLALASMRQFDAARALLGDLEAENVKFAEKLAQVIAEKEANAG